MNRSFRDLVADLPPLPGAVLAMPGDVAEIVIDAPATRNALHPRMMVELADAVEAVSDARVVLLYGARGTFCSGGDLGAVRAYLAEAGMGDALARFMHATTERLASLDAPVIGVVTGAALGGGAELLTACDLVYASPDAKIGWVQAQMGVLPGFGGGTRLVERVGPARALQLLADARVLSAADAHAMGLVDVVTPAPLDHARARARGWLAHAPEVLRSVCRLTRTTAALPRDKALDAERALFDRVWAGPAHRAALDRASRK